MALSDSLNMTLNVSSLVRSYSTEPLFADVDNFSDATTSYEFDLGPVRDSLSSVIPITIIYSIILVTGFVGNICTCVVIFRNKHMRTATNYYLFSLAISDLLLLMVGLPQELYLLWYKYPYVFGEAFCIIRGFTSEMSTNASILIITSFTTERYLAICHPLRTHTMSKLSRAVTVIIAVWIIASLSAIHVAIQFGIVIQEYNGTPVLDTAQCTMKNPIKHSFISTTLVFFIIPMSIMSVLYALMGIQLRASESVTRNHSSMVEEQCESLHGGVDKQFSLKKGHLSKLLKRHSTRSFRGATASSRKAVIKMLFAVVVAFFLCWAPFHAQRLMATYVNPTPAAMVIYTILTHISGVTYYVSATINPILYSIMSNKFRQAFKNTLAHCCRNGSLTDRPSYRYNSYTSHTRQASSNNGLAKNDKNKSTLGNESPSKREWRHLTLSPIIGVSNNSVQHADG